MRIDATHTHRERARRNRKRSPSRLIRYGRHESTCQCDDTVSDHIVDRAEVDDKIDLLWDKAMPTHEGTETCGKTTRFKFLTC